MEFLSLFGSFRAAVSQAALYGNENGQAASCRRGLSSVLSYTGWVLQSYLSFAEETVRIPVEQEQS